MASKAPTPFLLQVQFETREDGGLRARCEKVPNFFLSHSDPDRVRAEIEPTLSFLLSEMFGLPMRVQRLADLEEALFQQIPFPPHLCKEGNYIGQVEGH